MNGNSGSRLDLIGIWSAASVLFLAVPIAILVWYGIVVFRSSVGFGSTVFYSIELTVISSAVSSLVVFLLFTPAAYDLARRSNPGLETLSDLPASIPHPIVGISLLLLDSNITPAGRFLQSVGINFFDTFQGLVIALMFVSAPIYIRAAQSLFSSAGYQQELFASSLGASRTRTLFTVLVPSHGRELLSITLTSMSRAMSEFGSIAIIAYYINQVPFRGIEPAPVLIYEYYGYYGPQVAITAASLMILFSVSILVIIRILKIHDRKAQFR
jgi:molybdate/tungstate transport system permease protein